MNIEIIYSVTIIFMIVGARKRVKTWFNERLRFTYKVIRFKDDTTYTFFLLINTNHNAFLRIILFLVENSKTFTRKLREKGEAQKKTKKGLLEKIVSL